MILNEITKIVAESEDKEIVTGTISYMSTEFGISEKQIRNCTVGKVLIVNNRKGKEFRLFRVTNSDFKKYYKPNRKKEVFCVKEPETELQQTVRLLKQYGNTNVSHHPKELVDQLELQGLNVSYRPMKTNEHHYILELDGYYY